MAVYEIPLTPAPQILSVPFPNGVTYSLRFNYQFNGDNCWLLDIGDANQTLLVCSIPLITGADLLAQYGYLGFGCAMFVTTDADLGAVPTWYNLGVMSHLWLDDAA